MLSIIIFAENDVHNQQWGAGSVFMKLKGELINENYNPAFALKLLTKDLRLAKAEGLDSPLGIQFVNFSAGGSRIR
ncbi:hypothetical protein CS542_04925 [Pedobacter sp. IW39]|nr:hypothetical protein CS542_04925 [Pedobacter sp. IW39]